MLSRIEAGWPTAWLLSRRGLSMTRYNATATWLVGVLATAMYGPAFSAAAPTVTASVTPSTVSLGQSTVLKWSSTNATTCSWFSGKLPGTSGSSVQFPPFSTSYTITCTGTGGSASKTVSVAV